MATYFADTSFWVAIVDRNDSYNVRAVKLASSIQGTILTTTAVLLETANMFSKPTWRQHVIPLIDHITARPDVEIVQFKDDLWQRAWKLFSERPDKAWSLTDCISFEVMREHGVSDALTSDSHFRQSGFHALLLENLSS